MNTIPFGIKINKLLDDNRRLQIYSCYIRSSINHIFMDQIPVDPVELRYLRSGHKVHIFIDDLDFIHITTMLQFFVENAYIITGNIVTIHVNHNRTRAYDTLKSLINKYPKWTKMIRLIKMTHSEIFLCSKVRRIETSEADVNVVEKYSKYLSISLASNDIFKWELEMKINR